MPWCFSTRASVATMLTMHQYVSRCLWVDTLRLRKNGQHLADNIFKSIHMYENFWISIWKCLNFNWKISLKFVPELSINNKLALVQVTMFRWQAIIRTNDSPVQWRSFVSSSPNELITSTDLNQSCLHNCNLYINPSGSEYWLFWDK